MAKKSSLKKKGTAEPKKLLLLDTHAILHRAYHALPDLTSSDGTPTGALYGLMTMLLKSIADLKPDYIVAARDLAGKTHRHDVYEAYKGTRAKTDDALIVQLGRAGEVFDAFGIPVLDAAGFEADDVVGTVARQVAGRDDLRTVILTGDMDILQLIVDGRVTVYRLITGITNMKFYDEEAVKERYGFGPEHVVDYKGMCGDSSDNIKGIKGIGEKTATELIQKFGSIEEIYKTLKKNPGEFAKRGIKPRVVGLLEAGEEDAAFSKMLATIRTDAPVTFELPDHPWRIEDHAEGMLKLSDKLEFRSLKERIRALGNLAPLPPDGLQQVQQVDAELLEETSVALWLLDSDSTTPTLEDILSFAKAGNFESARKLIFDQLKKTGRLQEIYDRIEKPLIPVVRRMNDDGVRVDSGYLAGLEKEYTKELEKIAARIYKHAGHEFNINSPKQLGTVLYDELNVGADMKQKKTATGARTTREEELAKMAHLHPIIEDVLSYRELQKLLSTYIEKIPRLIASDGRLHAEFLQTGTTTGRMGCQNPNLQNIPVRTEYGRRIRNAFVADKGFKLVAIDYSQIELRIAAGLSGDKKLVQVFKDGRDVHTEVASQVFGVSPEKVDREMRRRAKIINFGILYGMGVNALRANLSEGLPAQEAVSRDDAARFLEEYFKNFAGVAKFVETTKEDAARLGYTETLFGRRRYFPGFKSSMPMMRAQAERMAVNAPIQGTQADIIKRAMVESAELIKKNKWEKKVRLLLQVHDELVYEVEEGDSEDIARELRISMESVVEPRALSGVPIVAEVSIGGNWGQLEKVSRL